MTVAGADKHALARAIRGLRRDLRAALPQARPDTFARELFRAVVERHARTHDLSIDPGELPWLFDAALDGERAAGRTLIAKALDASELSALWSDASVLGWVYQFWRDESREAIDARIGARGRVQPDEIAEKTQLFTERYMVDWLLENSLGALTRSIAARRRERLGKPPVPPTTDGDALRPSYFVAAAGMSPDDTVPERLEDVKVLDPACGSGHFLLGAFDLLVPRYRAEAADEGRVVSDAAIAETILARNLHGIDIDSEAVRVTATVLLLAAKRLAAPAPFRAPPLWLLGLGFDPQPHRPGSPSRLTLAASVPGGDRAVAQAVELLAEWSVRGTLSSPSPEPREADVQRALTAIVAARTPADDLGLIPAGQPLGFEERLVTLLTDGRYDVVVANPPYLATAKIDLPKARLEEIFGDRPDLFAAFVERSLTLCKPRGRSAFVAPSNWLYLATFADVRARVLAGELVLVADLGKGAFRHASKLIQTSMVVVTPQRPSGRPARPSWGARIGNRTSSDEHQTERLAAGLFDSSIYHSFDPAACAAIPGAPLLFWLGSTFLERYRETPKIEAVATGAVGTATTDNERFLRAVWEIPPAEARAAAAGESTRHVPYLKGADGAAFFDPYRWVLRIDDGALAVRLAGARFELPVPRTLGVAYTTIGHRFAARLQTVPSVRDISGASFFPRAGTTNAELLCALDRTPVRELAHALNPTINFQQGDVRRLPFERHPHAEAIVAFLRARFDEDQRTRETSLSFRGPGPSCWEDAQRWAQRCIDDPSAFDRSATPDLAASPPDPADYPSAALGLVLGRFARDGEALRLAEPNEALGLPHLLIDADADADDDLATDAAAPLRVAWEAWGPSLAGADDAATLERYLRFHAFSHHLARHGGRPAYLPLASSRRTIVVYVWAQRFDAHALRAIVARVEARLAGPRNPKRTAAHHRELAAFVEDIHRLLADGPASPDHPREVDAPFATFPSDGVRVLGASLWSLVYPLWKEPRADWNALAAGDGKRHADWSRVAERWFPARVDALCRREPSIAAEHGRLEALHPEIAARWTTKLTTSLSTDPP